MAEPTEMPFGMWTWLGPRKHVLDGCTLWPPGEYDWTVRMRQRCGLTVCEITWTTCYFLFRCQSCLRLAMNIRSTLKTSCLRTAGSRAWHMQQSNVHCFTCTHFCCQQWLGDTVSGMWGRAARKTCCRKLLCGDLSKKSLPSLYHTRAVAVYRMHSLNWGEVYCNLAVKRPNSMPYITEYYYYSTTTLHPFNPGQPSSLI